MKIKITTILILLILAGAGLALSEDSVEPQANLQEDSDSNTQWVWGEVASVDSQGKALTLKYLDYESDQEKEISLNVDEATTYQNVKSLDEIQLKNNLSIDYIVKDGKNIVKSISLEQSESASPVAPLQAEKPDDSASISPQVETITGTEKPEAGAPSSS